MNLSLPPSLPVITSHSALGKTLSPLKLSFLHLGDEVSESPPHRVIVRITATATLYLFRTLQFAKIHIYIPFNLLTAPSGRWQRMRKLRLRE